MLKNEPVFKWEVLIGDDKIEMTDKQYQQLQDAIERNVKVLKFSDKMINPTYFKSSKKIYKNEIKPASDYLDWSELNKDGVSENYNKISADIKTMLKKKNMENPNYKLEVYKDEKHLEAVADVWEHLKSSITALEFPIIDDSWKADSSITRHSEGRESHSVEYKTKVIDLGDKFDSNFWAEANFIFCETCKKHLRKQIVIFNDYESECVVRNLL